MARQSDKYKKLEYIENKQIYNDMKFDFVYNNLTPTQLSKKYDIPTEDINRLMINDNWVYYRQLLNEAKEKAWFRELETTYIESHIKINKQCYDAWQQLLHAVILQLEALPNASKTPSARYLLDIAGVIEKAQDGTMKSNKMLTMQEEEQLRVAHRKLDLEEQKLSQDNINAPVGNSLESIMATALDNYNKTKKDVVKEYVQPTVDSIKNAPGFNELKEVAKQNNEQINKFLSQEEVKEKASKTARQYNKAVKSKGKINKGGNNGAIEDGKK